MSTTLYYCPGCDDVVEAGEPCQCVFVAHGTVDAHGVLHTARREPLDDEHVIDDCIRQTTAASSWRTWD